jgi:hypothetical protein
MDRSHAIPIAAGFQILSTTPVTTVDVHRAQSRPPSASAPAGLSVSHKMAADDIVRSHHVAPEGAFMATALPQAPLMPLTEIPQSCLPKFFTLGRLPA